MSYEEQCERIFLIKKDGTGLINYKEISAINIDKFLENHNSYYTSDELWSIVVEKYKDSFHREINRISFEERVNKKIIIQKLRQLFQYRVYEASIIEAICKWHISNSKEYILETVTNDEDFNNKIDLKFRHKKTQICLNMQIKKYTKNINYTKRTSEKFVQIKSYGVEALYFDIEFSEKDRTKRSIRFIDSSNVMHYISFSGSFGRNKNFHKQFISLLNLSVKEQLKNSVKYLDKR